MKTALVLLSLLIPACGKQAAPELRQAKDVLEDFIHPLKLRNSMFAAAYPDCKASQFVKYILSPAGASELPLSESIAQGEDMEISAATGVPLWPDGVAMVAGHVETAEGKQIVLKANDAGNTLIVEMYDNPADPPEEIVEWEIPVVEPTRQAKMFFQANAESGLRFE